MSVLRIAFGTREANNPTLSCWIICLSPLKATPSTPDGVENKTDRSKWIIGQADRLNVLWRSVHCLVCGMHQSPFTPKTDRYLIINVNLSVTTYRLLLFIQDRQMCTTLSALYREIAIQYVPFPVLGQQSFFFFFVWTDDWYPCVVAKKHHTHEKIISQMLTELKYCLLTVVHFLCLYYSMILFK